MSSFTATLKESLMGLPRSALSPSLKNPEASSSVATVDLKIMFVPGLCGLLFLLPVSGEAATNRFSFEDYLVAGVRVHLLSAKDSPAIQTTLAESDIARILAKVNGVWAQAGLH